MTDQTEEKIQEYVNYKGQLTLQFNRETHEFSYALVYYEYPRQHEPQFVTVDSGDDIVIRNPADGYLMLSRVVEYEYETGKAMNLETGKVHQMVAGQPVNGIMVGIEPTFWLNLFLNGYYADLKKKV